MKNDPLGEACRHLANSQKIIEAKNAEIERLRLTDEEIEAIVYFAHFFPVCAAEIDAASDILRNLLERTKDND